ncbi:protein-tyrosine phosphatase [Trypanosoma rangeli]|uniref:Protein-tyrosine phosphatase n=1 Tax=Trypanosoma rangeli TaxID=5698 RepID=A0A3R7KFA6_TRYRA|nr:protein-tyrosine phosphatase [Trypanosoma rangeli]RNF06689.1 protein-tyrosine phosphatase [Trypanosoma rangeli]|eukprot:RNF06689.1 protein-tyrosine phosphatase [Trypanosoma rangeli]
MTELFTTREAGAAGAGDLLIPSLAAAGKLRCRAYYPSLPPTAKTTAASIAASFHESHGAACIDTDPRHTCSLLLNEEDVTFLFAAMTWNVDLLEVLLAKAENPLHTHGIHNNPSYSWQQQAVSATEETHVATLAKAVFPTLEEALLTATSTTRARPRNKNYTSGGHHSRRSKRRKIGRGRATQLRVYSTYLYEGPAEYDGETEEDEEEEVVAVKSTGLNKGSREKEGACSQMPYDADAVRAAEEAYDTYLTEEEEFDMLHTPHRRLEPRDGPHDAAVFETFVGTVPTANETASRATMPLEEEMERKAQQPFPATMRDFLRLFFQSFLIVVCAMLRYQEQHALHSRPPRSLTALEYRAICFVRQHLAAFKGIMRRHVIGRENEVERRAAQSLLVDAFQCDKEGDENKYVDWKPLCAQVYISGREPVSQPLLLEVLRITRVLQCHANPPSSDVRDPRSIGNGKDMALNSLYCWRRLVLEGLDAGMSNLQSVDEAYLLFVCSEERDLAHELFRKCLSPLVWEPYRTIGPYTVYTTELPYSKRLIAKLVLPAEDLESYDLSKHFQEGVFRFLHGTPFFPFDATPLCGSHGMSPPSPRGCSLVHCSAGMHRSSGIAIAYLLWLVFLSHSKLPVVREVGVSVTAKREEGEEEQKQRQQPTVSYLSAVLRHREPVTSSADTMAADTSVTMTPPLLPAAVGDVCVDVGGVHVDKYVKKTDLPAHKPTSVVEVCMEHVRRQRSMAVPIPAVQEYLRRYACYLRLQ